MAATKRTDWEVYYQQRSTLASLYSKRIITHYFMSRLKKYRPSQEQLTIAELGGSHSFFYPPIQKAFSPSEYHIVDSHPSNSPSLGEKSIIYHQKNILDCGSNLIQADIVFSAGLIEHFTGIKNSGAIEAHFKLLKPGGIALISFPIPSQAYRFTRRCLEKAGLWIFLDEVPIPVKQAYRKIARWGDILETTVIWPLPLTQALIVARAKA